MRHANHAAATTSLQHKWIRANTRTACRRVQSKSHCACIVNAEQMEARNDVRFLELEPAPSKELRLRLPAWLSARREILGTDAPGERLADPGVRGRHGMAVIEIDRLIAM